MLNAYSISVIVFVLLMIAWLVKDRKKIDRKFILFMRKTKKGRQFLYNLADRWPRFWAFVGDLGIFAGFVGMLAGTWLLIKQSILIFSQQSSHSGLSLILPVATTTSSSGSFWVGVPFWNFLIAVVLLIFIHEGFHGIQTRLAGVKIKSMGLALLAVLPGAFVEPDEKALNKKSLRSRLRVFAAGSMGNFILAGMVFLMMSGIGASFSEGGVGFEGYVFDTENRIEYPAQIAGIQGAITHIDGVRVFNTQEFLEALRENSPGETITVTTTVDSYEITLAEHPEDSSRPFLGIGRVGDVAVWKEGYRSGITEPILENLIGILYWVGLLNFGIGLFNLLPIKPLDGGHMWHALMQKILPKSSDIATMSVAMFILFLIIFSFAGPHIFG